MQRTVFAVLLLTGLAAGACADDSEPGLLVRLYDVGEEMSFLPDLAAGQWPNVVKVVPTVDLQLERKDFDPFADNFLTEVSGRVATSKAGVYNFRLISDDGAKLWIDDRLVIDHDGPHGATPKDGRIELSAGEHELRIRHFNGSGGAQLTLQWQPADSPKDGFELVPAAVLSHAADAARDTTPGKKKIIPPLRRGRPGDGTPVEGVHPAFTTFCAGPEVGEAQRPAMPYEGLTILANPGDTGRGSVIWLPPNEVKSRGVASLYLAEGPYQEQLLVAALGRDGLDRLFVEPAGDVFQGCVLRFTQGLAGSAKNLTLTPEGWPLLEIPETGPSGTAAPEPRRQVLQPREKRVFEIHAVRARTNGFEIEFTKALDPRVGWDPESYYVEAWPFDAAQGVPPARDGARSAVKSASVAPERKRVFLELDELRASAMYYIRVLPPCLAEDGELPWGTEAWYTLNVVPANQIGTVLPSPPPAPQNTLSAEERQGGWRLLFDGQTAAGWHGFKKDRFPSAGWRVLNGCLVRVAAGGDIATDDEFDNFELQLEWRIAAGGNSGIFFRSSEEFKWPWETGPEVQVLDNAEHADGKNPKTSAGSNYALHAPLQDVTEPVGLFNKVRIVAQGPHVEYWLNDVKVVDYELQSPAWEKLVAESKFKEMPSYGRRAKGRIVLQDHGDKVWYRNIKIRVLAPE